jgi:CheY-like chemotaxis protein
MEWVCHTDVTDSEAIDNKTGILVVDDDQDFRRMLAMCLVREGFRVTCAASGYEALVLLKSGAFYLMLTDYNMPGMDGLMLSEEALKASPELIIVMITGASLTHLCSWAEKFGITAVLPKPFNINELYSIIRQEDNRLNSQPGPTGISP